nr:vegetative cell wall protein gp1-like [Aegilops tauschii subsp. strangulata]
MTSNYFESFINFDPRAVDYSDLLHSSRSRGRDSGDHAAAPPKTPGPVPGAAPPPLRLTASTRRASSPSSPRLAPDTRGALRPTSPRGAPRRRTSSSPSPSSTSSSPSPDHPDPRCLSPYRPRELRSSSSFPCSRARKPTAAHARARPGPPVPDCRSLRAALLAVPFRCPPWPRSGRVQSGLSRARAGPRRALSLQPTGRPRAAPATAVLGHPPPARRAAAHSPYAPFPTRAPLLHCRRAAAHSPYAPFPTRAPLLHCRRCFPRHRPPLTSQPDARQRSPPPRTAPPAPPHEPR